MENGVKARRQDAGNVVDGEEKEEEGPGLHFPWYIAFSDAMAIVHNSGSVGAISSGLNAVMSDFYHCIRENIT